MSIVITGAKWYVGKSLCKYFFEEYIFKTISKVLAIIFTITTRIRCDFSKPLTLLKI